MIDADSELVAGKDLGGSMKEKMANTKQKYESISDRLSNDAFKYIEIYREEIAQSVSAHLPHNNNCCVVLDQQ